MRRYHADVDDPKLTVQDLQELVVRFKKLIKERTRQRIPSGRLEAALGRGGRRIWFVDE